MKAEEIMEIFHKHCEEIGTIKRMNSTNVAVLIQLANTLAKDPSMTEQKVLDACKSPTKMMALLR